MPKKIRVYELARELGLTNKEALDLCVDLGIGVKSHSSSIEDAQADRARRKADRDGLRRAVQPEEPSSAASGAASDACRRSLRGSPRTVEHAGRRASRRPPAGAGDQSRLPDSRRRHGRAARGGYARRHPRAPPGPTPRCEQAGERDHRRHADARATASGTSPGERAQTRFACRHGQTCHRPVLRERPADGRTVPQAPSRPATGRLRPGCHGPGAGASGCSAPAPSAAAARVISAPAAGSAGGRRNEAAATATAATAPGPSTAGSASAICPAQSRPDRHRGTAAGRPFRQADPAAARASTIAHGPPDSSSARSPAPRPTGAPELPARCARPTPGDGSSRRPARLAAPPAGRQVSPRPRRWRRGIPASSRPVLAPRWRSPPAAVSSAEAGEHRVARRRLHPRWSARRGSRRPCRARPATAAQTPSAPASNMEELEPIQITAYLPSSAPVPDHEVIVERGSTPQQLGPRLNRSAGDIVRFLLLQGEMVTATQPLTDDMIDLFAAEIGAQIRLVDPGEEQEAALRAKFFGDEEEDDETRTAAAASGHHGHGPRRPRQDAAARPDPRVERGRRRGRRHHPAHRRLPGRVARATC